MKNEENNNEELNVNEEQNASQELNQNEDVQNKNINQGENESQKENNEKAEKNRQEVENNNFTEEEEFKAEKKPNKLLKWIRRIVIVLILLGLAVFALDTSRYYRDNSIKDKTNFVLNNTNVTERLKEDIIVEDGVVYLSMKDAGNFLDYYIYKDEDTNQVITTSDKKIAAIGFEDKTIVVNGSNIKIKASAIKRRGLVYIPFSELADVYDMEIEYNEKTDILTADSLDRKQEKATATKNLSIKSHTRVLSRTVEKIQKSDTVIIIKNMGNGWSKVRAEDGKIGFVQNKKLSDYIVVRENVEETPQVEGKINMFWDYYSEYHPAPDRTGEKYEGVNVVSPAFFYINADGEFVDKVGESAEKYIEWAHGNGYKIWPMISNTEAGSITPDKTDSSNILKATSKIMNSYENRQKLIEDIVNACRKHNLDGINIDFEYMYEKDKDMFSRFIIELTPRMKEYGLVTSVDVTAPDGSPNWSLCYDRYDLGKIADYIVFMAYDQYTASSKTAGTTAGYNWIETALIKFIDTYEVDSKKIILAMPLYTRLWTETSYGSVSSSIVKMKDIESKIPKGTDRTWLEDVKQYYVEIKSGAATQKMWIEDKNSIKEKVSLVFKYNLAGVSCWQKDLETDDIWGVIDQELNKEY